MKCHLIARYPRLTNFCHTSISKTQEILIVVRCNLLNLPRSTPERGPNSFFRICNTLIIHLRMSTYPILNGLKSKRKGGTFSLQLETLQGNKHKQSLTGAPTETMLGQNILELTPLVRRTKPQTALGLKLSRARIKKNSLAGNIFTTKY